MTKATCLLGYIYLLCQMSVAVGKFVWLHNCPEVEGLAVLNTGAGGGRPAVVEGKEASMVLCWTGLCMSLVLRVESGIALVPASTPTDSATLLNSCMDKGSGQVIFLRDTMQDHVTYKPIFETIAYKMPTFYPSLALG